MRGSLILLIVSTIAGVTAALVIAVVAFAVGQRSGMQEAYAMQTSTVRAFVDLPIRTPTVTPSETPDPTATPVPTDTATATPAPTATQTPTPVPPCGPLQTKSFRLSPSAKSVVYQGQLDPSRWIYFWLSTKGNGAGYVTWATDSRGEQVYGYTYKDGPLPVFQPPYPDTFTFYVQNNAWFVDGNYVFEYEACKAGTAPGPRG